MRYFFHIAYQGELYNGWQKHPQMITIQDEIESSLSKIFKKPLEIVGCGRTDTGVHASQFFFHIDLEESWDFDLVFRLNKTLSSSIQVFGYYPVNSNAHARFDARSRTYEYFIHRTKDPYLKGLSSFYDFNKLNFEIMEKAMKILLHYQDFRAFCKSPNKYEHTLCFLKEANLFQSEDEKRIGFQFTSNRFLSGMIRILVQKILDIGTHQWSLEEFEYHLKEKITPELIKPAHSEGLYLSKVSYPFLDLSNASQWNKLIKFW